MEAKEKEKKRTLVLRFEGPGAPLEAITLLREALKNARPFHLERVELSPLLLPSGEWEDGKLMTYRDGAVSLVVDRAGDVSLAVEGEGRFLRVFWVRQGPLLGVGVVENDPPPEAVGAIRETLEGAFRLLPTGTLGALALYAALTLLRE